MDRRPYKSRHLIAMFIEREGELRTSGLSPLIGTPCIIYVDGEN